MSGSFQNITFPDHQEIKQLSRDQLKLQLESVTGKKDLVIDGELMKPLDRIAGAAFLKQHGVDRIFKLESAKPLPGCEQRIYIVRPNMVTTKYIADQINADINSNTKRKYKILMVPRKLYVCEHILEQEGVYGHVDIEELQIDLVPLDADILSLEIPSFFRAFYLDGDQTWVHTVAKSLLNLQQIYGLIPNVYSIGRCAEMVKQLVDSMFEQHGEPRQLKNEIGHLFVIDRDIDYVTPLCSQVTYEGLLDDTFGVKCGLIEFGAEVTGKDQPTKLLLTSQDEIYDQIRNRHFSNVSGFLSAMTKELQQGYDKRHNLSSVNAMKNFVANDLKNLKQQHKSLSLHIGACECIMNKKTKGDFEDQFRTEHSLLEGVDNRDSTNYVEEMINRQFPVHHSLRLLCLLSLTQGGLSPQTYKSLKTQFLHSYGFEHMLTFHNLKRLGMFTEQEQSTTSKPLGKLAEVANIARSSPFRSLARKLNLIPKSADEVNLRNPNDMSYVFSGAYTPMLCKLIDQVLTREGFAGLEDTMKLIPHPYSCSAKAKSMRGKGLGSGNPQGSASSRVVLVYFIGGCTYSEIAALRFLGKLKGYKFLIATTSIINGTGLMDTLSEKKNNI